MPSRDLAERIAAGFGGVADEEFGTAEALFGGDHNGTDQLRRIPLDRITPRADQPRQSMDSDALDELTESIRDRGVLQPIRVRSKGDRFEIIAGERRWTAAGRAGLRDIPAVIANSDDDAAFVEALIENIQREDLNAVDRAQALKRLRVNLGLQSWEEVGRAVGITRQHVYNLLNLMRLPALIQEDIRVGDLTEKHGRALVRLHGYPTQQEGLWHRIHTENLSGDAAVLAAKELRPSAAGPPTTAQPHDSTELRRAIQHVVEVLHATPQTELAAVRAPLSKLYQQLGKLLEEEDDPL